MTTPDMLELAHETLRDISGRAGPDEISAQALFASAAAAIAQAKEFLNIYALLCNATDLNGAVKFALPHPVEQALIAIAERRRPQVMQVGSLVFDPRAIRVVEDDGELLRVHFFSGTMHRYFRGSNRAAFLAWWNEFADVVRLPQVPDVPAE